MPFSERVLRTPHITLRVPPKRARGRPDGTVTLQDVIETAKAEVGYGHTLAQDVSGLPQWGTMDERWPLGRLISPRRLWYCVWSSFSTAVWYEELARVPPAVFCLVSYLTVRTSYMVRPWQAHNIP